MKKRFLTALLAVVMCLSVTTVGANASNGTSADGLYSTYYYDRSYEQIVIEPNWHIENGEEVIDLQPFTGDWTFPSEVQDSYAQAGTHSVAAIVGFSGCTELTGITVPEGVVEVDGFSDCTALTTVNLPSSLTSISGFQNCTALTEIKIPEGVTDIGNWTFSGCTGLTSVDLPQSLSSLGVNAFNGCINLKSIEIPGSLQWIEEQVFSNCTGLTSVVLDSGVERISFDAFQGCTNLTSIMIPESVTEIYDLCGDNVPDGLTIYGYSNSYAEKYANENEINFVSIGEAQNPIDVESTASKMEKLNRKYKNSSVVDCGNFAVYVINQYGDSAMEYVECTYDVSWETGESLTDLTDNYTLIGFNIDLIDIDTLKEMYPVLAENVTNLSISEIRYEGDAVQQDTPFGDYKYACRVTDGGAGCVVVVLNVEGAERDTMYSYTFDDNSNFITYYIADQNGDSATQYGVDWDETTGDWPYDATISHMIVKSGTTETVFFRVNISEEYRDIVSIKNIEINGLILGDRITDDPDVIQVDLSTVSGLIDNEEDMTYAFQINNYEQGNKHVDVNITLNVGDSTPATSPSTSPEPSATPEPTPTPTPMPEPDPVTGFTDTDATAYYADAVEWAVANNITSGTSATTFSPDNTCTREQVVTFLWRANGCPEPTTTENPFTDVDESSYAYKAILWAVENGITSGTSATTFSPASGCTRGQVVTFLWRAAGEPEVSGSSGFSDVSESAYYAKAVAWAVENGITSGTSVTTFSPDDTCTRAQIVTFLYRDLA